MSQTVIGGVVTRGEQGSGKWKLDDLAKDFSAAQAVVISFLPRGALQVVQPVKVPDALVRTYNRETHATDALTWNAIKDGGAVAVDANSATGGWLKAAGYAYAAAAPLTAPIFSGYPGAVVLLRIEGAKPFTDQELKSLASEAKELDEVFTAAQAKSAKDRQVWEPDVSQRVFALDAAGAPVVFDNEFDALDDRLKQQMISFAKKHAARNGVSGRQHRLLLPDSTGDHWVFNTATYKSYAGLGGVPVVFFCLQPGCRLWSAIRPTDFAADEEISRLIPSLKLMRQEFSRGPTLGEISRTVHLSPFHFHRRFTELLGLTPKHFMLDCQVGECKSQLLSGKKSLAKIAKDCGFAHQSHFTSRFKQATGMTPTRWRRMARERFAESAD